MAPAEFTRSQVLVLSRRFIWIFAGLVAFCSNPPGCYALTPEVSGFRGDGGTYLALKRVRGRLPISINLAFSGASERLEAESGRIMAGQYYSEGTGRGAPPSDRSHIRFRVRPGSMSLPRHDSALPFLCKCGQLHHVAVEIDPLNRS